jgi:hypothetical protein
MEGFLAGEVLGADSQHLDRFAADQVLLDQGSTSASVTPPYQTLSGTTSRAGPARQASMQPAATTFTLASRVSAGAGRACRVFHQPYPPAQDSGQEAHIDHGRRAAPVQVGPIAQHGDELQPAQHNPGTV